MLPAEASCQLAFEGPSRGLAFFAGDFDLFECFQNVRNGGEFAAFFDNPLRVEFAVAVGHENALALETGRTYCFRSQETRNGFSSGVRSGDDFGRQRFCEALGRGFREDDEAYGFFFFPLRGVSSQALHEIP